MKGQLLALATFALVVIGVGGATWGWIRTRDEVYDDGREIAQYGVHPSSTINVPDDVVLPTVASAGPLDPRLLDISVGKKAVRVHGRIALDVPDDAAAGFGPSHVNGALKLQELTPMVTWGRKLDVAVDADASEANLLIDEQATYAELVEVLYTLGQAELATFHFVVRMPAGLGVIDSILPRSGNERSMAHGVCIVPEGLRVFSTNFSAHAPRTTFGAGCVAGASGVVAGWTDTGFDVPSLAACLKKLDDIDVHAEGEPSHGPKTPMVVAARADVRFGRALTARVALGTLGLEPRWGAACDAPTLP